MPACAVQVLWSMVMTAGFSPPGSFLGAFMLYPVFAAWAALTISVMGKQFPSRQNMIS